MSLFNASLKLTHIFKLKPDIKKKRFGTERWINKDAREKVLLSKQQSPKTKQKIQMNQLHTDWEW